VKSARGTASSFHYYQCMHAISDPRRCIVALSPPFACMCSATRVVRLLTGRSRRLQDPLSLSGVSRSRNKKRHAPINACFACFKCTRLFLRGGSFGPSSFAPARQIIWGCMKGASPQALIGIGVGIARLLVLREVGDDPYNSFVHNEAEQVHCFFCFWHYLCDPW
jgi:hypothetical protein